MEELSMYSQNYTTTFTVDQTPKEAFSAINNVRGWWSGEIDGSTGKLGDVFTYRYEDVHYSKQKITEFIRNNSAVWTVLYSKPNFIKDTTERNARNVLRKLIASSNILNRVQPNRGYRPHFPRMNLKPSHREFSC